MEVTKVMVCCSFPERKEAVEKCIEIAKQFNTVVNLSVLRCLTPHDAKVTITKTSKQDKIIRYVEHILTNW